MKIKAFLKRALIPAGGFITALGILYGAQFVGTSYNKRIGSTFVSYTGRIAGPDCVKVSGEDVQVHICNRSLGFKASDSLKDHKYDKVEIIGDNGVTIIYTPETAEVHTDRESHVFERLLEQKQVTVLDKNGQPYVANLDSLLVKLPAYMKQFNELKEAAKANHSSRKIVLGRD